MISCESSHNLTISKDCDSSSECENTTVLTQAAGEAALTPEWMLAVVGKGSDCEFEAMLGQLGAVLARPEFQSVLLRKELHYRLMKSFYRCFKQMEDESEEQQHRLIFTMSLMAEIARRNEKVKLPFTRKIVQAMLSFDCTHLEQSAYGQQIIKILAVLL